MTHNPKSPRPDHGKLIEKAKWLNLRATPRPWEIIYAKDGQPESIEAVNNHTTGIVYPRGEIKTICTLPIANHDIPTDVVWASRANAELIIGSRTLLPELVSVITAQAAEIERLKAKNKEE